MLQHAGASDDAIQMAQQLRCTCQLSKPPKRPHPSRPEVRAVVFNTCVHADLKYLHDYKQCVCVWRCPSLTRRPTTTRPSCSRTAIPVTWQPSSCSCGSVYLVLHRAFVLTKVVTGNLISSSFWRAAAVSTPNSSDRVARGVTATPSGVAVQATVEEKQLVGRVQMKLGLSACQAKNSVISRGGHSAHASFRETSMLP